MISKVTHRERIQRVISGEKPDRIPIAFWRHFPIDDQTPEGLAKAVIDFQSRYDFDFVKVTPISSLRDVWRGNPEGTRDYLDPLIQTLDDFNKIKVLDPTMGKLRQQLNCLALIRGALPESTPLIQTIFSPLAQFKNLVGKANLSYFLRCFPNETLTILNIISDTTNRFIEECKKRNIDGIFYAIQHATYDQLNENEYENFGKKFDLQILSAASDLWLNVLHLHGTKIMFDLIKDYPCQILNWHDRETIPALKTAKLITDKVLCGGLSRVETMVLGDKKDIKAEILDAIQQTGSIRFILSTGCVLLLTTPQGNIETVCSLADSLLG
jgi:uroporphyrinogen decarboxylase